METLLDDYKRKLQTAEKMIKEYENDERLMDAETLIRITTKAAEYRSFIVDIERALSRASNEQSNCNIRSVSVRSSGTTVHFLLSENGKEQSVHFDGSPSDNYIDIYFEGKYGGVHKWWI